MDLEQIYLEESQKLLSVQGQNTLILEMIHSDVD